MKKRILSLFLTLIMIMSLLSAFPVTASAEDNITWDLTGGVLTISGTGEMTSTPWRDTVNNQNVYHVIIDERITSVAKLAFFNYPYLYDVSMKGVKVIKDSAFELCVRLKSIEVGEVECVEEDAFNSCSEITSFPFEYVKTIGNSAFRDSGICGEISLDNTETIGSYGFANTGITSITANKVKEIAEAAFWQCSKLESFSFENAETVGKYALSTCKSFESIAIPDSVHTICDYAFKDCTNLKKITIGKNVKTLNGNAFSGCSALTELEISPENENFYFESGRLYTKDKKTLLFILPSVMEGVTDLTIDEGVEVIGSNAFYGSTIPSVTLPQSLKEIGSYAFYSCVNLTSITFGNNLEKIGGYAFASCTSLSEINFGNSLKTVGEYAFYQCSVLTGKMIIPEGVTTVGGRAFHGCTGIEEIVIPSTLTELTTCMTGAIPRVTFAPGSKIEVLKKETFYYNAPKSIVLPKSIKVLETQCFYMASQIESITFEEGSELEEIQQQAVFYCQNLVSFTIPDKVKKIGTSPISYCSKFTELKLLSEDSDYVIDNGFLINKATKSLIFGFNKNISSYTVPDYVEKIESHCFYSLNNLKTIVIPKSVKKISGWALYGANGLVNLTIPFIGTERGISGTQYSVFGTIFGDLGVAGDVHITGGIVQKYSETMDTGMVRGYYVPSTLRSVTVTDETVVPYGAFYNCTMITSITLPETVKEIKPFSFYKCSGISKINIPKDVKQLGASAFSGCSGLTTVNYSGSEYAWNLVDIKSGNDKILSAKKNFSGQNLTAASPEITITDEEGGKRVDITSAESDVRIYYTIDGSTPTLNSKLFAEELLFDKECDIIIKAIAVKYGYNASAVVEKGLSVNKLSAPVSSQNSGVISADAGISLLNAENSEIYYTTDGKDPAVYGEIYADEIKVALPATIKAIAKKDGFVDSDTATFRYVESYEEPEVKSIYTSAVGKSTAVLSVNIANENRLCLPEINFTYYNANTPDEKITVSADGEKSVKILGLSALTDYMFCVSVKNGDKVYTSEYTEFSTTDYDMPESVSLSKTELKIAVGGTKTIEATVYPESANDKNVKWKSSAPRVAYVDKNGKVFGKKAGSAIIAATAEGGIVAECRVVVYEKYVTGEHDFSEINMATNTRDFAENGFDITIEGGNAIQAVSYLARWDGVVAESDDEYPPYYSSASNGYDLAYLYKEHEADYHVQNIYFLRRRQSSTDNAEIKEAVMKYGAVSTSFNAVGTHFNGSAYYMPYGAIAPNHAVVIVGWNDNFPKERFKETPPGDGAFICKNSWGTDSHTGGFFFISYYDCTLGKYEESYVIPELETKDNYDNIFQYDLIGPSNKLGYTGTTYAANVFPQRDKKLTKDEQLKAVSFYTTAQNMSYEIYVVPDYKDSASLVTTGEPVLCGTLKEMGYHTLDLDKEVPLKEGTRFAVIVKLSRDDATQKANFFVESPVTYYSKAKAGTDESFMSPDGSTWTDIGAKLDNTNVCIKAFTDDASSFDKLFRNVNEPKEIAVTPFTLRNNAAMSTGALAETGEEDIYTGFLFPFFAFDTYLQPEDTQPELPERYDLRELGQVSPVKNQNRYGTCWTFSAYASLESSIMKRAAEAEEDLNVLGAKMTYDANDGILNVSSRHPAVLYIATYDGAKMVSVETYTLDENTLNRKFDFDESKVAFIWDENLISLCSKFSLK